MVAIIAYQQQRWLYYSCTQLPPPCQDINNNRWVDLIQVDVQWDCMYLFRSRVACFQIGNSRVFHGTGGFATSHSVDVSFVSVQLVRTSCLNALRWTSPTVVQRRCDNTHNPDTNVRWQHAHHYHRPTTTTWTTTPPPLTTATMSPPAPALATPTTFPVLLSNNDVPTPPLSSDNNDDDHPHPHYLHHHPTIMTSPIPTTPFPVCLMTMTPPATIPSVIQPWQHGHPHPIVIRQWWWWPSPSSLSPPSSNNNDEPCPHHTIPSVSDYNNPPCHHPQHHPTTMTWPPPSPVSSDDDTQPHHCPAMITPTTPPPPPPPPPMSKTTQQRWCQPPPINDHYHLPAFNSHPCRMNIIFSYLWCIP